LRDIEAVPWGRVLGLDSDSNIAGLRPPNVKLIDLDLAIEFDLLC